MRIDCGNRVSAGLRYGLTLWLGVSAATWVSAQSAKRALVSHVAPSKGAAVAAMVPEGAADALMEMATAASVIFAGHVESVTRNDAAGFVDVQFRIDQALRGCPATGVYVLREWAGLWSGAAERYRVGQRLLMLLPARGPSGMSAPVGGLDGAMPIVGTGMEPLLDVGGAAPADDGSGSDAVANAGVDLRWVAARAARGTVASSGPLRAVSGGAVGRPVLPSSGDSTGEGWSGPVAPLNPPDSSKGASAATRPSLSAVLALLRGSGGVGNGAR